MRKNRSRGPKEDTPVKNYTAKKEKKQDVGFETEMIEEAMKQSGRLNLEQLARIGAQKLIARALILEVDDYFKENDQQRDENGNQLIYRNGTAREREILTGIGPITVKPPRVDDRQVENKFSSKILPKYARRAPSIDTLIPILYLRGISTGDFGNVLESILGKGHGVSANTVMRLKKEWEDEYKVWCKRDFDGNNYCYRSGGVSKKLLGIFSKFQLMVSIQTTRIKKTPEVVI